MRYPSLRRIQAHRVGLTFACVVLVLATWSILALVVKAPASASAPASTHNEDQFVYLPTLIKSYVAPEGRLCRFGVGAGGNLGDYNVNSLRMGWYVDWTTTTNPSRPGGISYMPTIRLSQTGSTTYSSSPSGSALTQAIQNLSGNLWLIGNEPDRRDWQDSLEPGVYARAYHDLYYQIKGQDPTAKIAAGSIVQPTPLRLQYLDMVLNAYKQLYHASMPVDVWNIHGFILHERSCTYYPDDCWGAEIPPGIDAKEGMLYGIDDNDNIAIFQQFIQSFRQWMADRGYQSRPLIITEFGVQMPPDLGFPSSRVNAYMDATFSYLLTATGPTGNPNDNYHLVQRWAWYSLTDNNYNGWLFDEVTKARTVFGDNYANRSAAVTPSVNLTPIKLWSTPGASGIVALRAEVINNGNISTGPSVGVRFYRGNPSQGGQLIGAEQFSPALDGCVTSMVAELRWTSATPGSYTIYAVVDATNQIAESNEADNTISAQIVVPSEITWLPATMKQ